MAFDDAVTFDSRHGRWTRSGSVVSDLIVVILIVVAIVGAAVGKLFVTALCGLVLVVAVVSRLWARLAFVDVDYRCFASNDRLLAGDVVDLTLVIENRKPLPVPWLGLTQTVPGGFEIEDREPDVHRHFGTNEIREATNLGQYERVTYHYRLRARRRGHFGFGPTRLVSGDIFGFYQARLELPRQPPGVVVYPRTVPLPDFDLPSRRPIGDVWSRSQLVDDPLRPSGLREYQTGDAARRIDWKATARRDAAFVRTYDPSVSQRVVILLECNSSFERWRIHPDVLEAAVTAAASVAARSIELGYAVGVVSNGNTSDGLAPAVVAPGAGPNQLTALMTTLAGAGSRSTRPLEDLVARHGPEALPFGATVVYVAGAFLPPTVEYVTELGRRGHRILALYVGETDPPEIPGLPIEDYRAVFLPSGPADA
ncbi:MAG: DUF58 domain-containing protein [Alphaproteobacteria bacterium]|jgi:uncharacterized protein (DUF58 family)|nr:DUF58 domain-containing protein [Alphaproteobacteria bacterium]